MIGRRKGFTLIELLVVIAIIAILAAILFPVFARARENARKSTCQSNVKQIMLGVLQYIQDYDEMTPGRRKGAVGTPQFNCGAGYISWAGLIQPYLKNSGVYVCPSRSTSVLGYGYGLCGGDADAGVAMALFQSPATTVKVGDCYSAGLKAPTPAQACSWVNNVNPELSPVSPVCGGLAAPHMSGANLGFMDGHVKWMQWSALKASTGIQWVP